MVFRETIHNLGQIASRVGFVNPDVSRSWWPWIQRNLAKNDFLLVGKSSVTGVLGSSVSNQGGGGKASMNFTSARTSW
jgi:hypothetical protein